MSKGGTWACSCCCGPAKVARNQPCRQRSVDRTVGSQWWGLGVCLQVDAAARLSVQRDKNCVLFSGTKVLQHTGDKGARVRTPDGGCLAVVLRTGFETSQGAHDTITRFRLIIAYCVPALVAACHRR